ncbi:MAG TPA: MtrAB system histidine kinase MtrB [Streptosporangiaceae bacterium]|nr:MtrAB system histidine kinase MtrB [Streptosporangiaceae bacterium]
MKGAASSSGAAPSRDWVGALRTLGVAPDAAARLRRMARRRLGILRRRVTAAHRVLRARWLRSLQLRVVTTTLVISAMVVTVLGFFLMQQITSDQLQAKELQAGNVVVTDGLPTAHTEPGVELRPGGTATQNLMDTIVSKLQAPPEAESSYGVAVMLAGGYSGTVFRAGDAAGVVTSELPTKLVSRVNELQKAGKSTASFTFATMGSPSSPGILVPGLVYGVPVGPYYQLYYFFPLTQVQQSLTQIQHTLLLAGVVLVFLFVAIAALVTRWVVTPVRHAARGAQRLSTGNLGERMPVRGVDELAALAASFNEMAASLQEKMTALEDLSHVQRQFVSDVSHELRTPLTTIKIASDVLFASREQLDGPASRSAELLQSQLERFESLLTDLLEISRYDANVAVLDAEPVDICDLARQSADVAQQLAERRGAKIEFRLPADPCIAEVDRVRVERILRNLLVNAVEHGEGKDAVVTVAGDSVAVAVAVRDYGIGLAAGEERLVFDRFWRADPARARTTGGTGLGLAIALEDARLHSGWLEAWGEVGRGSVFRLTLPRAAGAELAGSPLPLAPDEADGSADSLADTDGTTALSMGVGANGTVAPGPSGAETLVADQPAAAGPSDGPGEAGPADPGGAADGVAAAGTSAGSPGQPRAGSRAR